MSDKKRKQQNEQNAPDDALPTKTIAESENYVVWLSQEPDGEIVYHVELGAVTLHFFQEEWEELVALIRVAEQG
ncbi:MAG: hypothetical protein NZ750_07820 [Anaerolineae bacterium]|nr:hypothetical protein [Anaerolineae bacterium]MDW8172257.1 hypothetical protein [Anaerolineae bacterium]